MPGKLSAENEKTPSSKGKSLAENLNPITQKEAKNKLTFQQVAKRIIGEKKHLTLVTSQVAQQNQYYTRVIDQLITKLTKKLDVVSAVGSQDQESDLYHASTSSSFSSDSTNPFLGGVSNSSVVSLIDYLLFYPDEVDNLNCQSHELELLIGHLQGLVFEYPSASEFDAGQQSHQKCSDYDSGQQLQTQGAQNDEHMNNDPDDEGSPFEGSSSESSSTKSSSDAPAVCQRTGTAVALSSINPESARQSEQESSVDTSQAGQDDLFSLLTYPFFNLTSQAGASQSLSPGAAWGRGTLNARSQFFGIAPSTLAALASTAVTAVSGLLDPQLQAVNGGPQLYAGLASILNPRGQQQEHLVPGSAIPNRRRRLRPTHVQATSHTLQPQPQPIFPPAASVVSRFSPIAARWNSQVQNPGQNRLPAPILAQIRAISQQRQREFTPPLNQLLVPPPPPPPAPPLPGQRVVPPQSHEAGPPLVRQQHLHHPPLSPPTAPRRQSNVLNRHSSLSR